MQLLKGIAETTGLGVKQKRNLVLPVQINVFVWMPFDFRESKIDEKLMQWGGLTRAEFDKLKTPKSKRVLNHSLFLLRKF